MNEVDMSDDAGATPDPQTAQKLNELLEGWRTGDKAAYNDLVSLLHNELKRIAHFKLLRERADHSLQTTELVNKFYIKMEGARKVPEDYAHFLCSAAWAMKSILIDHARVRGHRPDRYNKVDLDDLLGEDLSRAVAAGEDPTVQLRLEEAFETMWDLDPEMVRISVLKMELGLTLREISSALDLEINKVRRNWQIMKKYLAETVHKEA